MSPVCTASVGSLDRPLTVARATGCIPWDCGQSSQGERVTRFDGTYGPPNSADLKCRGNSARLPREPHEYWIGGGDGLLSSPRRLSFRKTRRIFSASRWSYPQVVHSSPEFFADWLRISANACTGARVDLASPSHISRARVHLNCSLHTARTWPHRSARPSPTAALTTGKASSFPVAKYRVVRQISSRASEKPYFGSSTRHRVSAAGTDR
jgi:hypothetical protein